MEESFGAIQERGSLRDQGSPALEDTETGGRSELASEHLGRDRGGLRQLHCRESSVNLYFAP